MTIDFSVEPFFDDYSEDKKFHKILFRPGYAVQARELTQLQTILQEQIRRHGDNIFKEGAMVIPGQIAYDLKLNYVKLQFDAGINVENILSNLVGKEISNSNGLLAKVVNYTLAEGEDNNTIYVKYLNSVQDTAGNNVREYSPYDVLTPVDGSAGLDVTVADTYKPVGYGCSATIQRGVYYIQKNFVLVTDQTIILDKYTNSPSYRVGLSLKEDIVYPEQDESLLDNALGSPNYSAPGAARYYVDLQLTKLEIDATADENFIDLLRIRNGKVEFKLDRTLYSELEKTLARRTYDESGDYSLNPFNVSIREFRNNLRGDWSSSEKYIQGDLIKVPDGQTVSGSVYFVATTDGVSGIQRPNFANSISSSFDVVDGGVVWKFQLYPNFNNGIHTFTSGQHAFTLDDHRRLNSMMVAAVEGGKAYVRGYEIEKLATEYVPMFKGRAIPAGSDNLCAYLGVNSGELPAISDEISVQKTIGIDVSMGSYILAQDIKYIPDISGLSIVNLHSVTLTGSPSTATVIGTARVRALEKHEGSVYKVFLFDIVMNVGKSFSDVKSIYTAVGKFACNAVQNSNSVTVLNNPERSSLIYNIPDYAISSIDEVSHTVVVKFESSTNTTNIQLTAPANYEFDSVFNTSSYIVCNSAGDIVTPTGFSVTGGGSTLNITVAQSSQHTVLATLNRYDSATGYYTANATIAYQELTSQAAAQAKSIQLNHSYVLRVVSVMHDARTNAFTLGSPVYSENITNRYSFDSGQTNTHIGLSGISLLPGAKVPTGPIRITYEYIAFNGAAGNFIGVNTYTADQSEISYEQIPSFSGNFLRDCLDLRPRAVGGGFATTYFPKFGTKFSVKYRHYLPRIDNISLDYTGKFILNRGIPSLTPVEPRNPDNSMKLAALSVEPYTFNVDNKLGVVVNRIENKRYTMRDIGKLERRIQDLEYYTSLTLIELETKNLDIVDADGMTRYQNGFLVDSFDGQGIGDAASDDWNASIDSTKKELRPFFSQKQVSLLENVDNINKNYKVSGDIVTLPFTETELLVQNKASITENLNPYALYSWKGIVNINPWSDTWFSTHHRPDIILNDESQYKAIVSKAEADGILGTVWNSWQTLYASSQVTGTKLQNIGKWSEANTTVLNTSNYGGTFWRARSTFTTEELDFIGNTNHDIWSDQASSVAGSRVITVETSAVQTTSQRVGTKSFVVDKVDSRVLEDRVVDTQVIPYIRPRAVLFTGYGLKPSTAMYGFFDNILVNDYIVPATRLKVNRIAKDNNLGYYPYKFDTERNAGSAVSNPERTVYYSDGVSINGTVAVTNGSDIITGTATSFLTEVNVGDIINFGGTLRFEVLEVGVTEAGSLNTNKLRIKPAYNGPTDSGISVKVIGSSHTTEEVEVAFNHGEVIKEYVNGQPTGNSAIVVGQEVYGSNYYLYVMNIKGHGQFSSASNSYLKGEYATSTGEEPRVQFVERYDYTSLTTSFTGLVNGIFRIPSSPMLKFKTGTRELRFSDNSTTSPSLRATLESTSGGAIYQAQGMLDIMQRTIISTRTADIVSEQVSDTNTIVTTNDRITRDTGWYDPLAETFLVQQEGGAFITSVDLFFAQADAKVPVRIEIREVVNGYPGSKVLPFSRVEKKASEVNVSTDGSAATTFTFTSPVYLQNGTEYALVALSDSNNYLAWVAKTDTIDVLTNTRIMSQPYNGVLFKSQNGSAWTPDQTEDLKFTIRRAVFSTTPSQLELIPPKLNWVNLGFNPFNFIKDSKRCRVEHKNHGMAAGEKVRFKSRQVINSINGIPSTQIFDIDLNISSVELDSYVVEFATASNSTGKSGGGYIAVIENYEFETAMIDMSEIVPPGTSISYTANVLNHANEVSSYPMMNKQNVDFEEVKVYPYFSKTQLPSGVKVVATLNPASGNQGISPVIDLSRLAMTMVSNKVDSPTVASVIDDELDHFTITNAGETATIGDENDSDPLIYIDSNNDGIRETLVVNSVNAPILFNNINNNIHVGDVLLFTYTGITDPERYMAVMAKEQVTVYDESDIPVSINLLLTLEPIDGSKNIVISSDGGSVTIAWLSHFKTEYAPVGGSTHSKYVTKKINFSRQSEMLKIMFSAMIPTEADVEIYYKVGSQADSTFQMSRYYKAIPSSYDKSSTDFVDVIANVEGLQPFDTVVVKLVMKSINKAKVPRIKDFRVIAAA